MAKPKRKAKKPVKQKPVEFRPEDEKLPEKPFDFGGLPDRDLKKNLGCG